MRVAIDVTTLRGRISGVGYYTARIVDHLASRVGHEIGELILLSNRLVDRSLPANARVVETLRFPIRSVWMQFLLPVILRRERPGLVHYTNYLGPAITATPYVVSVHDMSLTRTPEHHTLKKRLLTATLVPRIARNARRVLAPSESTKRDIVDDLRLHPSRIDVIPYAAPETYRPTVERPPMEKLNEPYFLFVGTIEPRKNLLRLLDAFAAFAKGVPSVRLVLVGDRGWKCDEIYARAAEPDIADRVVILGYAPEDQMPSLYSHAVACVYPSLFEGFGFPVVEAMACGTPVITSHATSLAEIGSGAALLIDPHDTDEICAALLRIAMDAGLRATLRTQGLARAASYSWDRTGALTIDAYRRALAITAPC